LRVTFANIFSSVGQKEHLGCCEVNHHYDYRCQY